MSSRGVTSLAEIARALNTTPQAVSNWKARDQVPHHVVVNINKRISTTNISQKTSEPLSNQFIPNQSQVAMEEDAISLSDMLLTIAEQIKVIMLTIFISIFIAFTHVQFFQVPQYVSWATVLLPTSGGNLGGLAGLASQFGVNVPSNAGSADLSSPSLFPELLRSRTFAEKILDKKFYTEKFKKELPLLAILTHGSESPKVGKDTLVTQALGSLGKILEFNENSPSAFSLIRVTASEPEFAKKLAEVVLLELEALNRSYKSQSINEKTAFIEQRITAVKSELEDSEQSLKAFSEQNRQISSPALQLDYERLSRDVEIQKGIFLTLKQQFELAKIEQVQEASIFQVLDKPQAPLSPINKNWKLSVFFAGILGIGLGIMIGFIRAYIDNSDLDERKKIRRMKYIIKKKTKDIILDHRLSGIVSLILFIGMPYYLGDESKNPVFFGMYSARLMLVNTVYVLAFLSSLGLFIYLIRKNSK